jgi:molybdate transport system substrate-binding protein
MQRLLSFITVLAAFSTPVAAQPPGLVVSVAASVYDALDEIAVLYRGATGVTVALNAGGSNTLARQIVEGAKAGLFISADEIQMDAVEKAGRIVPGTRTRLLTNELAVVVPQSANTFTLAQLLEGRIARLAMGEPGAVPAGVYGRKWLEHEGAWRRVEPKVIPFPTVRRLVGRRERPGRCRHRVPHGCGDVGGAHRRPNRREGTSLSRHRVSRGRDRRTA